ncbi:hypothetical protein DSL72_001769 [Monilinia vaccinii-corymbosi]|uniref:Uncharacterized protein n=1 Tax=Monilinia vaccinii-corymbosi TaxID=61207 RepID=A0A8A3PAR9_9HELO|nr:hypothetical protein DSL72_001769 [Monilinia vaccinii-corymbosi]
MADQASISGGSPNTDRMKTMMESMFSQFAERFPQNAIPNVNTGDGTAGTTPADQSKTTSRPRHAMAHPTPFSGEDPTDYPQFLGNLEAKLNIDGAAIGNQYAMIWYAFSRLTGEAAKSMTPWMESAKGTAEFTVEGFV